MQRGSNESPISDADSRKPAQPRSHWPRFYRTVPPCIGPAASAIHRVAEKARSRKLALAKSVPTPSFELPGPAGHARNTPGRRDKVSCVTRSCCNLWRLATPQFPKNLRVRRFYMLEYSTEDTGFHCTTKNFFHQGRLAAFPGSYWTYTHTPKKNP